MIICERPSEPVLLPPSDVMLLIEVAESSLEYDQGLKARIYASLGVPEYWVVNAVTLETRVHSSPKDDAYQVIEDHARDADLNPQRVASLLVNLSQLVRD
jgi:Uma2 family endonuclease